MPKAVILDPSFGYEGFCMDKVFVIGRMMYDTQVSRTSYCQNTRGLSWSTDVSGMGIIARKGNFPRLKSPFGETRLKPINLEIKRLSDFLEHRAGK